MSAENLSAHFKKRKSWFKNLCLEGHCREVKTSSITGAQLVSFQEHCSTLELSKHLYYKYSN